MKRSLAHFSFLIVLAASPGVAQTPAVPATGATGFSTAPAPGATQATTAPPSDVAPAPFRYVVDPSLVKEPRSYRETDGTSHTVALVKDDKGVTSEFVEDEVVVTDDPAEVTALVAKYHAKVLRQITANLVAPGGPPLPPVQTTPRTVLQIDASASPLRLEEEAPKIKAVGTHSFSSAKSANLAAIVANERAAGHAVKLNFLLQQMQFPTGSREQPDKNNVSDAYHWPEFDHRAWQYVLDAGIKMHPKVAIIDSGFWLNSQGIPCGYAVDALCETTAPAVGNSDLPRTPLQANFTGGSQFAGGESIVINCSGGRLNPCSWHGNRSASVALGLVDNKTGAAGMGGPVAIPMLLKANTNSEIEAAIELAVASGASIISISMGSSCNKWCMAGPAFGLGPHTAAEAFFKGVLVVAAAGNSVQDAGANNIWPCIMSLCVGAMNTFPNSSNGYFSKMDGVGAPYSNFGPSVNIWAPTNIRAMPDPASGGGLAVHSGTSAAAPYVAGVAALMKAVNPSLTVQEMWVILTNTSTQIVTSAQPDDQPQFGGLIAPLEAVVLANHGQEVLPKVVITSPKDDAKVGEQIYQPVTFTASALDIIAGSPPASLAGSPSNGQTTWCDSRNTCLHSPFYATDGSLNWPFPTTAVSLSLADAAISTYGYVFNQITNPSQPYTFSAWPLSAQTYSAGPVSWSLKDGPTDVGTSMGVGTSIAYVFSPTAKPGTHTITATFKNAQGLTDTDTISVDYAPQIGGPTPVIVYPPAGATFEAGTIPVRGYSYTGVNLGYVPCGELEWQQGIAAAPIHSTDYAGAAGICEAKVPFQAGSDTLRLTAKGPTGKVGTSDEKLTIAAAAPQTAVYIDDPTNNQQVMRFFGQKIAIGLHAFVLNPPTSGQFTYTWSWYPVGSSNKKTIGEGQTQTLTTQSVCGNIVIEVVVTAPSIPASANPTAKTPIEVTCSSSG
jgi:subtilisin family serine protease